MAGWAEARRHRPAATATTREGRAQEPVVRAGSAAAAPEQIIVESAYAQFATASVNAPGAVVAPLTAPTT